MKLKITEAVTITIPKDKLARELKKHNYQLVDIDPNLKRTRDEKFTPNTQVWHRYSMVSMEDCILGDIIPNLHKWLETKEAALELKERGHRATNCLNHMLAKNRFSAGVLFTYVEMVFPESLLLSTLASPTKTGKILSMLEKASPRLSRHTYEKRTLYSLTK